MYSPTSVEALAAIAWVGLSAAAGTDIIRISGLYFFRHGYRVLAENATQNKSTDESEKMPKMQKFKMRAKDFLEGNGYFTLFASIHIVSGLLFGLASWLSWTRAFRSEGKIDIKSTNDPIDDPTFQASWILSLITLILFWLLPTFLYASRELSTRVLWVPYSLLTFATAAATTVVFYLVTWEAGLLATIFAAWLLIVAIIGIKITGKKHIKVEQTIARAAVPLTVNK